MIANRGRRARAVGRRVLAVHVLSVACGIVNAQAPASPSEAVVELLRTAQLSHWVGENITSQESVCIQDRYGAGWPADREGSISDRAQDRLRLLRDDCAAPSIDPKRGLVASARKDFVARVARLSGLREAVLACTSAPADAARQHRCLEQIVGKPLGADDERRLVEIGAPLRPEPGPGRGPAADAPSRPT